MARSRRRNGRDEWDWGLDDESLKEKTDFRRDRMERKRRYIGMRIGEVEFDSHFSCPIPFCIFSSTLQSKANSNYLLSFVLSHPITYTDKTEITNF